MTHTKNNIPIYEEQQFLNEEQQTIQKILNDFKQPISTNYIKLKVEEGNYQFSTNSKWKDKPNYERYGFYLDDEEEWVQIDIPHNLVEELEIEKGKDITYPLYLTIDISQKKLIRGAYNIDNEKELFIDKPVSEKNVEKELVKRLRELEKLRKEVKELEDLKREKVSLEEKSRNLEKKVQEEQEKNDRLDEKMWEGTRVKEEMEKELEDLKKPKRSWQDFYNWFSLNIHDKREENGLNRKLWNGNYLWFENDKRKNNFLFSLESSLRIFLRGYDYEGTKHKFLLPYNDNDKFEELVERGIQKNSKGEEIIYFVNFGIQVNHPTTIDFLTDFNKLLESYRQATAPQTT